MNVKDVRRENLRALAKGVGGISALARRLTKSQSQVSHVIGMKPIKNIGDKFAAEVEREFGKPPGWLDREHEEVAKQLGHDPNTAKRRYSLKWIPLVEPHLLKSLIRDLSIIEHNVHEHVPSAIEIGDNSFAIRVSDSVLNNLTSGNGINSATLIIDPDCPLSANALVLTLVGSGMQPSYHKYIVDGEHHYLRPLNKQDQIELNDDNTVVGTIRQIQYELP